MYRPTLKQLTYLIAIHEHGSFLAAADFCNVTQSTMSAGIKDLESILEQSLVIRSRKQAALTPFGLEILDKSREILDQTDKIVQRAKLLKEPLSGPLRIGIIPTIAPYSLPEILSYTHDHFPRLEPQIFENLTDKLLESIQKSEIDVAIMAFPYSTPGMTQMILYEEPFYLATSVHDKIPKETLKINDLDVDKLLLLEDGHCLRDHALQACDLQLPRTKKTFSATSLPTVLQMVRAGFGMTLLPEMACTPAFIPPDIELHGFAEPQKPARQIGLCWRSSDPRRASYEMLAKSLL